MAGDVKKSPRLCLLSNNNNYEPLLEDGAFFVVSFVIGICWWFTLVSSTSVPPKGLFIDEKMLQPFIDPTIPWDHALYTEDPGTSCSLISSVTNFFAKSRRFWKRSVMTIGSAPAALAESCVVRLIIGPMPLFRFFFSFSWLHRVSLDWRYLPDKKRISKSKTWSLDSWQGNSQGFA